MKKKVCLFDYPNIKEVGNYEISTFSPYKYFGRQDHGNILDLVISGLNGYSHSKALTLASGIDRLYRERDPNYMRLLDDFVQNFKDFDLIVLGTFNFVHPDVLRSLKKPVKILGFVDDPHSTYTRGIPYLSAFDGAYYISPGYSNDRDFAENLAEWNCKNSYFWPLVTKDFFRGSGDSDFFKNRNLKISYIGNQYGSKVDRLLQFKQHFKDDFSVIGRWSFSGYAGYVRGLFGKKIFPYRVLPISESEKTRMYLDLKIGLNMHLSDSPMETGNMRMYEVPAHGALLLCDKGAMNCNERIFSSSEAVYYSSISEAIELAEYYLENDTERVRIAENGFNRFWQDYSFEKNLLKFLDWASQVREVK